MADTKGSALSTFTPDTGDYIIAVDNIGGVPATGAITTDALDTYLSATTKTLTNKTIDAGSNTITGLTESDIGDLQSYLLNITAESLSDLADVTITTNTSGEILQWNGTAWINRTLAEAGIVAPASTDTLTNKTINTASNTITVVEADISDLQSYLLNIQAEPLSDLSDVTITTIASGELLKWDGAGWVNNTLSEAGIAAASHTHTESDITDLQSYLLNIQAEPLSDLSDVTITTIASGELLKWNGSAWINNTLAEAGISATGHTHTESDITDLGAYIENLVEDTTPQLGGMLDVNGNALGDGTLELLSFTETASAVNQINITNAATGNAPTLGVAGNDTNIDLNLSGKGTGVVKGHREFITVSLSDLTSDLTTGTSKAFWRPPYAITILGVYASVLTAPTGSGITVDINDGGTTIMSTNKLTIDATEKTSTTAATAAGVTDSSIAADAEVTFDIDAVGSTVAGAGLQVTIVFEAA